MSTIGRNARVQMFAEVVDSFVTARCYAERGDATVLRLSVRLSVCDVQVS